MLSKKFVKLIAASLLLFATLVSALKSYAEEEERPDFFEKDFANGPIADNEEESDLPQVELAKPRKKNNDFVLPEPSPTPRYPRHILYPNAHNSF